MTNSTSGRESKAAGLFLLILLFCTSPLWLASGYPLSTRVAAVGGLFAATGGLALFRPVMRVGGPLWGHFNWITLEMIDEDLLDQEMKEQLKRLRDPKEILSDSFSIRQGALFIALGTVLNGFSGFVS